jgi:hypothetical protein
MDPIIAKIQCIADKNLDATRHTSLVHVDIEEAVSSNEGEVAKNVVWSLHGSNCFRAIRIIKKSSLWKCAFMYLHEVWWPGGLAR